MPHPRSEVRVIAPSVSPEEAAAVVAAVERFMRATSRAATGDLPATPDEWRHTALIEGISREPAGDLADPWINT